jgi:hypothetical protein
MVGAMRRRSLIAALAAGIVVAAGTAGAAWYLSSGNSKITTATTATDEADPYGGWEAGHRIGSEGIISPDEDSECALASNPSLARQLIICWSHNYYQCYRPDKTHAKDDPDWWTEVDAWEGPAGTQGDCTLARDALWGEGMISFGA